MMEALYSRDRSWNQRLLRLSEMRNELFIRSGSMEKNQINLP